MRVRPGNFNVLLLFYGSVGHNTLNLMLCQYFFIIYLYLLLLMVFTNYINFVKIKLTMYEQLLELGLSRSECISYAALLGGGTQTPPQLAKAANLSRVNAYAALRGLKEKGLANEREINKKLVYAAEPPTKLQHLLNKQGQELHHRQAAIDSLIPLLMNEYQLQSSKPGIVHYEGLEGIKKIYEDSLRPPHHEESLVMRSIYDSKEIEPYILSYIKRRAKLGIRNRTLSPPFDYRTGKHDKELLRESRFFKKSEFSIPTEISIYGDRVSLVSLRKDLIGTVIQSKDVAQTFRILFELLWNQAKTEP